MWNFISRPCPVRVRGTSSAASPPMLLLSFNFFSTFPLLIFFFANEGVQVIYR